MASHPAPPSVVSQEGRQSAGMPSPRQPPPSTALLIEYFENVSKDYSQPSVRVRVTPYGNEAQQHALDATQFTSPLPSRSNTVLDRTQTDAEAPAPTDFPSRHDDAALLAAPSADPTATRGRQRTRVVSSSSVHNNPLAPTQPLTAEEEGEEALPALPYRSSDARDFSDPQSVLRASMGSNEIVNSRQFQAIIASAIQELILPEIQAVRNELNAQAQLFHAQPNLNQVSNQATLGTSLSGRKRSRSLTALDTPLHRRNSLSIATMEGYPAEIVTLPPRPTSPNVPAALEAESLLRADLRSELKLTPPGSRHRERPTAPESHRLSGITDHGQHVIDPSTHSVFNLAEGAYRKRESQEVRMAALKARRAEQLRLRQGTNPEEDIPEDVVDDEPILDKTRFSMMTGERAESDYLPERDREITDIKVQLDEIMDHLKSSAADRSGRETDILAQISVLAENTQRSLHQLKDCILEETNVTVGALSYNVERYVGRMVQGPRPLPDKKDKGLGKSASYPQDRRTEQLNDPVPGPIRRTTTFLQGLVPGNGRANREKRENMERMELMMQKVLDELELLKRMKLGARRKANGEMFRADMRNRINPPEDAATYIDELRGDAANRERGESDEERMARIERTADDFEQERNKRIQMSEAIATETNIMRQSSKDVRHAAQPLPEGSQRFADRYNTEDAATPLDPVAARRLTPLRVEGFGNPVDDDAGLPPHIPRRPRPRNVTVEDVSDSPSNDSFARGDEGLFNAPSHPQTRAGAPAGVQTTPDPTRKISVKQPVGLSGQTADEPLATGSARESGVLGEHLEGQLGLRRTQSPSDHGDVRSAPTPVSKDERFKGKHVPSGSPLPPITHDFVQATTSQAIPPAARPPRTQYFIKDPAGRRQYFLGTPPPGTDRSSIFSNEGQPPAEYTRPWRNSGSVIASEAEEASLNNVHAATAKFRSPDNVRDVSMHSPAHGNVRSVSMNSPYESPVVEQLPSLFAATVYQEGSPSRKLKKKVFRKPITAELGIKDSPTSAVSGPPKWPRLGTDRDVQSDELQLDSPGEKSRKSWMGGFLSRKSTNAEPQSPATLNRSSLGGEVVTVAYPGPSQTVKGRNGYTSYSAAEQDDLVAALPLTEKPAPPAESHIYRDSMSDSIREEALYSLALRDELASGRHPASIDSPMVAEWARQQEQMRHSFQSDMVRPVTLENRSVETTPQRPQSAEKVITGPFPAPGREASPAFNSHPAREATPALSEEEPLPKTLLLPNTSTTPNVYSITGYYAPTAPLSPQKSQDFADRPQSPGYNEALYRAEVIKSAFRSNLQRRPTPPWPTTISTTAAPRVPRLPSNLANPKPRKPSTFKDAVVSDADLAVMANGQTSPSKTESSYKTALDEVDAEDVPLQKNERARPPSTYSHSSIGGDVQTPHLHPKLIVEKFERNRAKTPPDLFSVSSAEFSNSTRPFSNSPPAPAKFNYVSPARNSPKSHLNKPTRVPSGPRVPPPNRNFSQLPVPAYDGREYGMESRPSFASEYSVRTVATDEFTPYEAIRTDVRRGVSNVSANWVTTGRKSETSKA